RARELHVSGWSGHQSLRIAGFQSAVPQYSNWSVLAPTGAKAVSEGSAFGQPRADLRSRKTLRRVHRIYDEPARTQYIPVGCAVRKHNNVAASRPGACYPEIGFERQVFGESCSLAVYEHRECLRSALSGGFRFPGCTDCISRWSDVYDRRRGMAEI